MSLQEFQKYDPVWGYFSITGYDSRLLKDFSIVDEKTYDLFVELLCQNRKIYPPLRHVQMYISEFSDRSYRLLERDNCFRLLEKMALPLQMKHWLLGVSKTKYPSVSLKQMNETFRSDVFKTDVQLRWDAYFSFLLGTIQDLNLPYIKGLKKAFPELHKDELSSRKKAKFLENSFKTAIFGISDYLYQKETIWYIKDKKSANIYLRFSSLFRDVSDVLTQEQMIERELDVLNLVDRAVVWTKTNNDTQKNAAFDAVYDVRQMLFASRACLEKITTNNASQKGIIEYRKGLDSHEKD